MSEHIKMPAVTPIVRYRADGLIQGFAFPFPIFASEDLSVYIDGARQYSGFDVTGAGETLGGSVVFDNAPESGAIVTLERFFKIERVSDFVQGGDFSARSLNNELDYLVAGLQQVERENNQSLRYLDTEEPSDVALPPKGQRAGKALGFNGDGDPIAVSLDGAMAAPDYTVSGQGAVTRSSHDKLSDLVSVKDFGAVGDGLADDTLAIQQALAAHDVVYVPVGTYLIRSPIVLTEGQGLVGGGYLSKIRCASNNFNAVEIVSGFSRVCDVSIEGGLSGILLYGSVGPCVQNVVSDVQVVNASTGITLDGCNSTLKPCYWNNFARILIERPLANGVHLKKTGAGDTPNANRFLSVRVFSKSALTTGSGFYIQDGSLNNSFIDCETNITGSSADSCFRIGANASHTVVDNLLCENNNLVSNIQLDSGSSDTFLMNVSAMSDGAAIKDDSGGKYNAINAGYPNKNTLRKTHVTDLTAGLMRYETRFIDNAGVNALALDESVYLFNATNGGQEAQLPAASTDNNGAVVTVKKVDKTDNVVSIAINGGSGPDGTPVLLGEHNDYVTVISNGAGWYVIASNRAPGSTRYIDSTGTVDIDMAVDTYLVSSYNGALTTRLPPADAEKAIGRTITIKKTDPSSNAVTISEQGGSGPDLQNKTLSAQYQAITVVSNGA